MFPEDWWTASAKRVWALRFCFVKCQSEMESKRLSIPTYSAAGFLVDCGMTANQEVPERKRRSREEIKRLVGEFEASGLRSAEFCCNHGLALSALQRQPKGGVWRTVKQRRGAHTVHFMTNRSQEQSGNELSRLSSVRRLHWPATLGRFRLPAQSCVVRRTRSSGVYSTDYQAAYPTRTFVPRST